MPLPVVTPEQRADALEKAHLARSARKGIRAALKAGTMTLAGALDEDYAAKMKVAALLEALPGIGKVRAAELMSKHGIAVNRRVSGLGPNQKAALLGEFAPAGA
jgi:hypothetical protein